MTEVNPLLNSTLAGKIAQKLDAADGTKDGKIQKSIWDAFAQEYGGKTVNEFIEVGDAMNSITTYAVKNSKADKSADTLAQEWLDKDYTKNNAPKAGTDPTPPKKGDAGNAGGAKDAGGAGNSSAKETKAKELGLRATYNRNYYYSESEKTHYRWDKEKQTFVKDATLACWYKDGSYKREIKNADGSFRGVKYGKDKYPKSLQALNYKKHPYRDEAYAAQKLGLKETSRDGYYYDKQTKSYYKWNAETLSFDRDAAVSYIGLDGYLYANTKKASIITRKDGSKKEIVKGKGGYCAETVYDSERKITKVVARDASGKIITSCEPTYGPNGSILTAIVRDGNGKVKYQVNRTYHSNGKLKYEIKRDGNGKYEYFKKYNANGTLEYREDYTYDSDGKLKEKVKTENGIVIERKKY